MHSRVSDSWLKATAFTRAQGKSYSTPVIINSFSSETGHSGCGKTPTCLLSPTLNYLLPSELCQPNKPNYSASCMCSSGVLLTDRYPEGLIRTQIRLHQIASGSVQTLVSLHVHWGWLAQWCTISHIPPVPPVPASESVVTQSGDLNQRGRHPSVLR